MFITFYVREVFSLEVEMKPNGMANYSYAALALTKFCGQNVLLSEIDEAMVNRFILHRLASGTSPTSVRNERFALLRIVDHAAANGHCRELVRRKVRTVTIARRMPVGPKRDQLSKLLASASKLDGQFTNGISRAVYFQALIAVAYETGLRKGDLWNIDREQIAEDGTIALTMNKTGQQHTCRISDATRKLLDQLPGRFPLRFPTNSSSTYSKWAGRIKDKAGVKIRGLCQPIRRSAASYVKLDGGNSQEFLGHSTPGVDVRYYLIPQIIRDSLPPMPPPLSDAG